METLVCDVLVIGGGPAGCSAARAAAKSNANTLLIERKSDFGSEVACAEGIGKYLFRYLPFNIPASQFIWRIDGIKLYFGTQELVRSGEAWSGYSVDREKFDKWLSSLAYSAGASLFTNSTLLDFSYLRAKIYSALVDFNGKKKLVLPKAVVVADGWSSTSLKLLSSYRRGDLMLAPVYSFEYSNLDLVDSHFEQIYFDDFAPLGYGYVFPKSGFSANVGVGGLAMSRLGKKHFQDFLSDSRVSRQTSRKLIVRKKARPAVWGDLAKKVPYENIFLAGDVANHNFKPFIEGILPAIISGNLGGSRAAAYALGLSDLPAPHVSDLASHYARSEVWAKAMRRIRSVQGTRRHILFAGLSAGLLDMERLDLLAEYEDEDLETLILEEYLTHVKK